MVYASDFGPCKMLFEVSFIHSVVTLLCQLKLAVYECSPGQAAQAESSLVMRECTFTLGRCRIHASLAKFNFFPLVGSLLAG